VNKNPLYSISLGVASLQDDSVGVVTALSPATVGHFKFYLLSSIVGLGLSLREYPVRLSTRVRDGEQYPFLSEPGVNLRLARPSK